MPDRPVTPSQWTDLIRVFPWDDYGMGDIDILAHDHPDADLWRDLGSYLHNAATAGVDDDGVPAPAG